MSEWQRKTAASLRDQLALMGQRQVPSNRDGFDEEFDALRALDNKVRCNHDEFYTASLGSNLSKNRYGDVLPNEGTRVSLDPINSRGDGDYINANYIDGRRLFGVPFVYIATQAPLRCTIGDFWRMVFENNVTFIVMLCAEIENGNVKSERYWPEGVGHAMGIGPLTICLVSENHREDTIFRTISLRTADGREREIFHMQYVRWPDQGIPHSSTALMDMIHTLGRSNASVQTPILVHCSGGIGRTGVFVTLHIALALFQMEQPINIPKIVQYLKFCRSGMVQRKDQYLFTYYAVLREMEKMIWSIESAKHSVSLLDQRILDREAQNSAPRRRPPQHLPQHPAQSQRETLDANRQILTADMGERRVTGLARAEHGIRNGVNARDDASFGPTVASGYYDERSESGRGSQLNDVEQALRNMQLRTQSMRQSNPVKPTGAQYFTSGTKAQTGSSAFQGSNRAVQQQQPETNFGGNNKSGATTLQSVSARLPLETSSASPSPREEYAMRRGEGLTASPIPFNDKGPSLVPQLSKLPNLLDESRRSGVEVKQISKEANNDKTASSIFGVQRAKDNFFFSPEPKQEGVRPSNTGATARDDNSDLENASRKINSALFGEAPKSSRVAKGDLSLL